MKTILFLGFLFLSAMHSTGFAQAKAREISGKIISFEESFPLKGVQVSANSSGTKTSTAANGVFRISVTEADKAITVSLKGYEAKEVSITDASEYNVVLKKSD